MVVSAEENLSVTKVIMVQETLTVTLTEEESALRRGNAVNLVKGKMILPKDLQSEVEMVSKEVNRRTSGESGKPWEEFF